MSFSSEFQQTSQFNDFLNQDENWKKPEYDLDKYTVDFRDTTCPYIKAALIVLGQDKSIFTRRLDYNIHRSYIRLINSKRKELKEKFNISLK